MFYDMKHIIAAAAGAALGSIMGYLLGVFLFTMTALGGLFIQTFGTTNAAATATNLVTSGSTYPLMFALGFALLGFFGGWHFSYLLEQPKTQ